jgi:hypothetical protein
VSSKGFANLQNVHTHEEAAKLFNVLPHSVERASKVLTAGTPELVNAVAA